MSNLNNNNEEEIKQKKVLHIKRRPEYSLQDILNIYCCTHKIKDNEIQEKIKTIHYLKPSENIETNYDKDKGDVFPLSHHIMPAHSKKIIDEDEDKEEEFKEKEEQKNEEIAESKNDEISNCFLCGWEFLKGMSFQEKNTHINLCIEGKGEQNKKELISTYAEIENLQKNNQEGDNNVNEKQNNEVKEVNENKKNEKQKEEDGDNNDGDKIENKIKKNKRNFIDDNDDLML